MVKNALISTSVPPMQQIVAKTRIVSTQVGVITVCAETATTIIKDSVSKVSVTMQSALATNSVFPRKQRLVSVRTGFI